MWLLLVIAIKLVDIFNLDKNAQEIYFFKIRNNLIKLVAAKYRVISIVKYICELDVHSCLQYLLSYKNLIIKIIYFAIDII